MIRWNVALISVALLAVALAATSPRSQGIAVAQSQGSPTPLPAAYTGTKACIGNIVYSTAASDNGFDDEFYNDSTLNIAPAPISQTPNPPNYYLSSTEFSFGARDNAGLIAAGLDSSVYSDSSWAPSGHYNPFSLSSNGVTITASPIPTSTAIPYPTGGGNAQWVSGVITAPAMEYDYLEYEAFIPVDQIGAFPATWEVADTGLWIPTNLFPQVREADIPEGYGPVYGSSSPLPSPYPSNSPLPGVRQTTIFSYAGTSPTPLPNTPTALFVYPIVTPDPTARFHTYGALWVQGSGSGTVPYDSIAPYIDSVPLRNDRITSGGPMNPEITLQMFPQNSIFGSPVLSQAYSMTVAYIREYRKTSTTCNSTTTAYRVIPAPMLTPNPAPSPAATGVMIVQAPIPFATATFAASVVKFTNTPGPAHLLITVSGNNVGIAPNGGYPLGWIPSPNDPNVCLFQILSGLCRFRGQSSAA
jgi:hypothetical protein